MSYEADQAERQRSIVAQTSAKIAGELWHTVNPPNDYGCWEFNKEVFAELTSGIAAAIVEASGSVALLEAFPKSEVSVPTGTAQYIPAPPPPPGDPQQPQYDTPHAPDRTQEAIQYARAYTGSFQFMTDMRAKAQQPNWRPTEKMTGAILRCKAGDRN